MRRSAACYAAVAGVSIAGSAYAQPQRVIVPPKLTTFVEAEFPASEVKAGKGSAVLLQIAIDATGKVASVAVVESGGPAFDLAAVAAAKQFVFTPATVDGTPIPVKIAYRYQFTFTEKLIKKQTADFEGVVRDRHTKQPMPNVRILVDTGQEALTDQQGKFKIVDIVPGDHLVTISGESLATVGTTETFEASKKIDATYEVDRKKENAGGGDEDEEIVVTAPRLKKQVVSTEVQATQAAKVPGTQGDVLKVVENLPGVARAAAGSSSLVVWGSAPQDTRVYVDGVHVPLLYHGGGYRSILPSNFVKSVELAPGGYGPSYGRGLGGLVTVAMRPLDEEGVHGSVGADVIDASADIRAKLSDRVHVAVGVRKSYLDVVLANVTSEDVGDIVPIPRYWDSQFRLVYDLAPHETIEVGALASSDRISNTLVNPDPSLTTQQTTGTDFQRVYLHYEKHLADSSVVTVVPSFGFTTTSLANSYGAIVTDGTNHSTLFGLRADWHGPLMDHVRGAVGIDVEMVTSSLHRDGSIGAPPREGDIYVFGQPPPGQVNEDDWKAAIGTLAPYAEADISLVDDRLHIIPGARFEPYITSTSKTLPTSANSPDQGYTHEVAQIEPRISVRYAFTPEISAKAAFGVYHQAPQPEDLSAVFGSPTLGLSSAQHYLAGGTFQLTPSLSVEMTAFLSEQQQLVARSEAESPLIAEALAQTGIGRAYGTQFLLRQQQVGRFFGWVSYSILRSERKDAPGLDWRLFDYDQSHVFTALGSYDLGKGFEVGLRFRFATGYPRTPVLGAYFDASTNTYQPIFGEHNSLRIPSFASLDARVAKHFKWNRVDGEIYLDVQNVTDHSNPEEIVYNTNYTQRGYITGFPILPVIGARLTW
ncbi:MAG TPA: TonB-dependent receptor [Polyangiaceae bacterium]|jgi:TonB family protein|nr:TonB-dependent receptor [Polyangiaceae bacterium]